MSQTIEGGTGYLTPAGTPVTALAPEQDDVQQKLLGALLPGLVSVLPQLISAGAQVAGGRHRRPRRKDYNPAAAFADDGESFAGDEEAQQKFLGALVSMLPQVLSTGAQVAPHVLNAIPQIMNMANAIGRRPRRKDYNPAAAFADDGESFAGDEEAQQKFLGALVSMLPQVLSTGARVAPHVLNAIPQIVNAANAISRRPRRKDYNPAAAFADDGESFAGDEEAQQKFLGALVSMLPQVLSTGAQVAPHVLNAIPQIMNMANAIGRRPRRKDFDPTAAFADDGESFADEEEAQQKFLRRLLPRIQQALPQIVNTGTQVANTIPQIMSIIRQVQSSIPR